MAKIIILFLLLFSGFVFAQKSPEDTLIHRLQVYEGFDLPSNFKDQYRNTLRRVRRVYPLALEAARVIDSLDRELENIDKNRKQRKLMRQTHRSLKDDFKYLLKDLYVSEGIVLTKLIYRETGMTVREIISKYKNEMEASLYTGVAGVFDQDLDAEYYPNTDDFVIECVVQDIINGKVEFDPTFNILDKKEYKEIQKEYKESVKEYKQRQKETKKRNKTLERAKKKEKPQT